MRTRLLALLTVFLAKNSVRSKLKNSDEFEPVRDRFCATGLRILNTDAQTRFKECINEKHEG